jgi:hypothetical protein
MAAQQPLGVGHVVGWTIIVDKEGLQERRVEGTKEAEWKAVVHYADREDLGLVFITRIQTSNGIVETSGASLLTPVGTKVFLYECHKCGKRRDWCYSECYHGGGHYYACEECSPDY